MIYVGYVTSIYDGGETISVGGNKARAEMIAVATGGTSFDAFGCIDFTKKDVLVVDDNHGTNIASEAYKIRLSDKIGIHPQSDANETIYFNEHDVYTIDQHVKENAWQGHGGYVVFVPGGAEKRFWDIANYYLHYCESNKIPYFVANGLSKRKFMQLVKYAQFVVSASGVTLHEMVYQAVPTIAIMTSQNQIGNYSRFVNSGVAAPQDVEPSVIENIDYYLQINKNCIRASKKNMSSIIEYIVGKHNEINR